jgi:hypothetical protein
MALNQIEGVTFRYRGGMKIGMGIVAVILLFSLQRLQNLLLGKPVDRVPNFDIFMTLAALHIHAPLSTYYLDHRVLCEANLAVLRDFELDIVQAISDP